MTSNLMVWLIAAPALATVLIPVVGVVHPTWRWPLFSLAHVVSLALALLALAEQPTSILVGVRRGPLDVQFGLALDKSTGGALVLTALLLLAIAWFSQGYVRGIRLSTAFLSLLLLEQAAVNLVLLAGDLLALYAGLLTLSLALMLIIGIDFETAGGSAALRVFATLEVPAALAFAGFWLIDARAGTVALIDLARGADWLDYPSSWVLILPIVIALVSRAGLSPLQNWVVAGCRAAVAPGAIALAGVALPVGGLVLARLAGAVIPLEPSWLHGLMLLGAATAIVGGIGALRENSALGWLGYLAIGQTGFAVVGFTMGTSIGKEAGWVDLASTACAITLIGMGIALAVQAAQHTQIGSLNHLPRTGIVRWAILLGLLALAPLPPFATFTSRRLLLASLLESGSAWNWIITAATVVGTLLLAAAVWRTVLDVIDQPAPRLAGADQEEAAVRERDTSWLSESSRRPPLSAWNHQTLGVFIGVGALVVVPGLIPSGWLSGMLALEAPAPTLGADLAATVSIFLAVTAAPGIRYLAIRHPPERLTRLLVRLGKRWRLDLALDPYVLVGGLLLLMGRISAATLDQTLGRLARAR
jgi:multicomponent Na+:H+ antiporter subunit D